MRGVKPVEDIARRPNIKTPSSHGQGIKSSVDVKIREDMKTNVDIKTRGHKKSEDIKTGTALVQVPRLLILGTMAGI